jgi:hypothetical protein
MNRSSVEEVKMSESKIPVVVAVFLALALALPIVVRNADAQSEEPTADVY